jgi:chromosome segregation ATPase
MRTIHTWVAVLALAAGGAACKSNVEKKADKVEDKQKDVVEARRDVANKQRDVQKQQNDLTDARAQYQTAVHDRLAKIDMKLDDLRARTDAASQSAATSLKQRRDDLAMRADQIPAQPGDQFDSFKKNIDDSFDKLEKDIDDAAKNTKDAYKHDTTAPATTTPAPRKY